MEKKSDTGKRITGGIVIILVLVTCLVITSLALVFGTVSINNDYATGNVEINLNDGKPVIREYEFLFEPGMTVRKKFFVENNSTWSVYYKLYFDDMEGVLSDILEVTIDDGEKVLFKGKMNEITKDSVRAADDVLAIGERRNLYITFHYPEREGNRGQGTTLEFSLCADAVQTKNNVKKQFK